MALKQLYKTDERKRPGDRGEMFSPLQRFSPSPLPLIALPAGQIKDRFILKTATVTKTSANTILVKYRQGLIQRPPQYVKLNGFCNSDNRHTHASIRSHPSEMPFVSEMQFKFSKWRYSFQSSSKIIYVLQFLDCFFFFSYRSCFFCDCSAKGFFFYRSYEIPSPY